MPINPATTLLKDRCTFLDVSDLQDKTECPICYRNFGWKICSETPVQLRCGHIYGLSCIRKVVRTLDQRLRFPPCPECREDFLNVSPDSGPGPAQRSRVHRQRQEQPQIQRLSIPIPCPPISSQRSGQTLTTQGQTQWVRRAEELWLAVFDAVLDSPNAQTVKALARYSSIYEMYSLYNSRSRRIAEHTGDHMRTLETRVSRPWSALMEHLDEAGTVGIGDLKLEGSKIDPFAHRPWLEKRRDRLRAHLGRDNLFKR